MTKFSTVILIVSINYFLQSSQSFRVIEKKSMQKENQSEQNLNIGIDYQRYSKQLNSPALSIPREQEINNSTFNNEGMKTLRLLLRTHNEKALFEFIKAKSTEELFKLPSFFEPLYLLLDMFSPVQISFFVKLNSSDWEHQFDNIFNLNYQVYLKRSLESIKDDQISIISEKGCILSYSISSDKLFCKDFVFEEDILLTPLTISKAIMAGSHEISSVVSTTFFPFGKWIILVSDDMEQVMIQNPKTKHCLTLTEHPSVYIRALEETPCDKNDTNQRFDLAEEINHLDL